ncbi:hypothetical protein E3T25_11365 [Cryobacterium sandaracinum]|uniref:Uncharacterized protein n=1 Tax=Cryobacterium sandaracinum TaxID=1259247 RepID=A0ABY2JCT1_9MICO|nr:hypothetical protein [Cryobacterium sandaracinum]TFD01399.1 hypothetical protein E3T25_11365 [Cryobacterium sandaracinum]
MADLKNIALTIEASQAVVELKTALGVGDQMDLIKVGFAFAIVHNADLDRGNDFGTRGGSNYDTGGLDSDGLMEKTVLLFYKESDHHSEPYRAVETLMNKGLRLLQTQVKAGIIGSLSDFAAK